MGLFNQIEASDALEDLLERERAAVLDGRFDLLDRMSREKERLVSLVARTGASARALSRLRHSTERNGKLLDAMREGIAAAQSRLKALQEKAEPLQTYDASGRKSAINATPRPLGHRA